IGCQRSVHRVSAKRETADDARDRAYGSYLRFAMTAVGRFESSKIGGEGGIRTHGGLSSQGQMGGLALFGVAIHLSATCLWASTSLIDLVGYEAKHKREQEQVNMVPHNDCVEVLPFALRKNSKSVSRQLGRPGDWSYIQLLQLFFRPVFEQRQQPPIFVV